MSWCSAGSFTLWALITHLLLDAQGKPLLAPGRAGTHTDMGKVAVQMQGMRAYLPDLSVTGKASIAPQDAATSGTVHAQPQVLEAIHCSVGLKGLSPESSSQWYTQVVSMWLLLAFAGSSEAMLSGQKPPFRLLVRAKRASDGASAAEFRPGVSEPFVVRLLRQAPRLCCTAMLSLRGSAPSFITAHRPGLHSATGASSMMQNCACTCRACWNGRSLFPAVLHNRGPCFVGGDSARENGSEGCDSARG
jgi:hypothetical protein